MKRFKELVAPLMALVVAQMAGAAPATSKPKSRPLAIVQAPPTPLPTPVPRGKAAALVAGKRVSIEYGRIGLGGRTLDELISQLPADRIWRLGANQVTSFETEAGVRIGELSVPPGKYSLYLHCPADGPFSLVFSRHLGIALKTVFPGAPSHLAYEPWPVFLRYTDRIGSQELGRVRLVSSSVAAPVDPLSIALTETPAGATLEIAWGIRSFSAQLTAFGATASK